MGSLAFVAVARVVLVAGQFSERDGGDRFLVRAKSNVGIDGSGYRYSLEQRLLPTWPGMTASSVIWGRSIDGNAREILALAEDGQSSSSRTKTGEAKQWLRDLLADGPLAANVVKDIAASAGFSTKVLRTAREELGVKTAKGSFEDGWTWSLPTNLGVLGVQDALPVIAAAEGTFGTSGHLRGSGEEGVVEAGRPPEYLETDRLIEDAQTVEGALRALPINQGNIDAGGISRASGLPGEMSALSGRNEISSPT
jgi:putative DNA primase/helicase